MSEKTEAKEVDGRRLRSERSRLAIIEAALALQEEGIAVMPLPMPAALKGPVQ